MQTLNDDVVFLIVSFVAPEDARDLSAVCRKFHIPAKRRALSEAVFSDPGVCARFCKYMLEDIPGRLHWLRRLTLDTPYPWAGMALCEWDLDLLLAFFRHALNISYLSLNSAEHIAGSKPEIIDALAALRNLEGLKLTGAGELTLDIVKKSAAPLRKLELGHDVHQIHFHRFFSRVTPVQTVQSLELSILDMDPPVQIDPQRQWLGVHDLTLICVYGQLQIIQQAFPNIRTLVLHDEVGLTGPSHPNSRWSSLDYVRVVFENLRKIDISCPVRHLQLQIWDHSVPSGLWSTLRATTPVFLTLRASRSNEDFWPTLLRGPFSLESLRGLELVCRYTVTSSDDFRSWLDLFSDANAELPLVCMKIIVEDETYQFWDVRDLLRSLTLLASKVASIRYISLGIGTCNLYEDNYHGSMWWWRVNTVKQRKTLEAISHNSGMRVLAALQSPEYKDSIDLDALVAPERGRDVEGESGTYYLHTLQCDSIIPWGRVV